MLFSMLFMLFLISIMIFSWFQFLGLFLISIMIFMFKLESFVFYTCSVNEWVFMDSLSFMLIFLMLMLVCFILLMSFNKNNQKDLFMIYILMVSLFMCFSSDSLMMMYISFEISLIPLILMIMTKGSSFERFSASMNIFMYTLFGSLLFLMFLLAMDSSFSISNSSLSLLLGNNKSIVWIVMMLVFIIKVPMYGVHLWLPKAHVEAPVEGSMILAGVLLKLGGFGWSRLVSFMCFNKMSFMLIFLMNISLGGALIVSMVCLRQIDFKKLIAYSSVAHMSVLLASLFSLSKIGSLSGLAMMVAHGFCSSGMFFMGNMFYERFKTRNMVMFKGVVHSLSSLMVYWLLFVMINMGVPPFLNFFCEFLMIFSLFKKSMIFMFLLLGMMMLSVYYSLSLYLCFAHGMVSEVSFFKKESFLEMIIINFHLIFLIFYFLKSMLVMYY